MLTSRVQQSLRCDLSWLYSAIALAAAFRIALFVYATFLPLANESGLLVSPSVHQVGIDFSFFRASAEMLISLSPSEIFFLFVEYYERPLEGQIGNIIAGPVFPSLLILFDYGDGSPLPLAIFFLVLSLVLVVIWLHWMWTLGIGPVWLVVFALVPNPVWLTLNISSDLVFAVLFAIFFLHYFRENWGAVTVTGWLTALLLAVLTRPNGLSLPLFVLLDIAFFRHGLTKMQRAIWLGALAVAFLLFAFFLYPSFITEVKRAQQLSELHFFGHSQAEFLAGIYNWLPEVLDRLLSVISLVGAKILYFVGLRPSFSEDVNILVVLTRAAVGLILLPGILFLFIRGPARVALLIGAFLLPFVLGVSQDRYNLPVQPILFLAGIVALQRLFRSRPAA